MSVVPELMAVTKTFRQDCQRTWYQTQGGLMVTEQSLKTGGEGSDYSSKATRS